MGLIKKYSLSFLLFLAVVISIILSIILWSNPSYERTHRSGTSTPRTTVAARPLASIYSPTQAIYTSENRKQNILIDPNINIISEIRKHLTGYHKAYLHEISKGSRAQYFKDLNRPRSIVLNYQNDVTLRILNRVVKGGLAKLPNLKLLRIVMPMDQSHDIYLFRDSGYHVYRIHVSNNHAAALRQIMQKRLRKLPVKITSNNGRPLITYPKSVSMPQYEYLLDHQSRNFYILNLLNSNQRITHATRHGKSIYNNQTNRQLMFDKYKDVNYINDAPTYKAGDYDKTLTNSYRNLRKLNLPLNNLYYFGITPDNKITFRGFVEGFPIFNPTQFGTIALSYRKRSIRYDFSLNSLQIPIPNDRKRVQLPNTQTVMNTLKMHGYQMKKIQAVDLGYRWQNAKSYKMLANLIPNWFIKYNNHWLNYNQIKAS